jgi:hypothetical protein
VSLCLLDHMFHESQADKADVLFCIR